MNRIPNNPSHEKWIRYRIICDSVPVVVGRFLTIHLSSDQPTDKN